MGVVIGIIVIIVAISVIKGLLSAKNQPEMDEYGNMHCKGCGGTSFRYWDNNDGSTTYQCHHCGKKWTRY